MESRGGAKLCRSVCGLTVLGSPARLQYFLTGEHRWIRVAEWRFRPVDRCGAAHNRSTGLLEAGFRGHEHVIGPVDYEHDDKKRREPVGARALGIENMAAKGIQGRGVLADLHAHFGRARKFVGYDELMRVFEQDKVAVEKGDMLLLPNGDRKRVV